MRTAHFLGLAMRPLEQPSVVRRIEPCAIQSSGRRDCLETCPRLLPVKEKGLQPPSRGERQSIFPKGRPGFRRCAANDDGKERRESETVSLRVHSAQLSAKAGGFES